MPIILQRLIKEGWPHFGVSVSGLKYQIYTIIIVSYCRRLDRRRDECQPQRKEAGQEAWTPFPPFHLPALHFALSLSLPTCKTGIITTLLVFITGERKH